jgi:formyl-CoA transferase
VPQALSQPQVEALGIIQNIPGQDFRLTGLPLSFDGERPAIRSAAPRLGEHSASHLTD